MGMKKKEVILSAIEHLKEVIGHHKLKPEVDDEIRYVITGLEDSLKSKKEILREAAWGLRGGWTQHLAESRKASKRTGRRS